MLVPEQEHHPPILNAQPAVQHLQVLAKRLLTVAATQLDLEDLAAGRERRQLRQTLLAAAAHADQQRIALVNADHPRI